jgi:hypothetical protein
MFLEFAGAENSSRIFTAPAKRKTCSKNEVTAPKVMGL